MQTPNECVIYMCGDKVFGSYNQAFFYYKKIHKPIYYVYTPTMCKFKYVSDLDNHHKDYMNRTFKSDSYDFKKKVLIKQLNFWKGELNNES